VRRPSITDLAKASQVSVSTIDRILSGRGYVKAATVEHVLAAAERIGFHAIGSIRSRMDEAAPERHFGFLLNSKDRRLYSRLAEQLAERTAAAPSVRGRAVIRHLPDLDPDAAASALLELGGQCDAVACVCIDHPRVNMAVADLAARKVPVVAMISDISSHERRGFVGSNDWQLGRTAGWFMRRLCHLPGPVALLVGSDRYLCQQAHEASFRSSLRSGSAGLDVLEACSTDEADARGRAVMRQLLDRHPDLVGVMVAGGGLDGVTAALRERDRQQIVVIGTELTEATQADLTAGSIDLILSHPISEIADQVVKSLVLVTDPKAPPQPIQHIIPFRILVSENC
jgi:LacI family transcriptional regulator